MAVERRRWAAMSRGVEAFACIFCILLAAHVTLTSPVAELEGGNDEKAVATVEVEGEGEEEEEEDDYDLPQIQPSPIPLDTPRFVVKLSDSNLLCFSIQGFELFTYNIITSENLIMNAFMNVSQYEDETWMRGHTDLGFVMKVKDTRVKSGVRLFKAVVDSRKRRAIMGGFGEVDMHNGAITFTVEDAHSDIESQESNNEMFRVVMDEPVAVVRAYSPDGKFFDVYVDDSSGLAQVETHGLIGQFLSPDVQIDRDKSSLLLPDRDPVNLELRSVWEAVTEPDVEGKPCWYPAEGETVLEGRPYDYIVEHILATSYKFSKFKA